MQILLFSVLALVAEVLGTIGGFGSSMIFVPLAGFFFDFKVVLGITAIFHLFSNVAKISMFRHGLDKRIILQIGIPAVLAVIVGAALSRYVDTNISRLLLGIFLIGLSLMLLLKPDFILRPVAANAVCGGALSGFT